MWVGLGWRRGKVMLYDVVLGVVASRRTSQKDEGIRWPTGAEMWGGCCWAPVMVSILSLQQTPLVTCTAIMNVMVPYCKKPTV